MKKLLLLLVFMLGMAVTVSVAQSKRSRAAKEFMREKLELSQNVLEGITLENFELIRVNASRLHAMSKEVEWRLFENPDYEQQSVAFRRQVNALVKAAQDKNIDTATLAYLRVTMSCVDCHKLVRGKLTASLKPFPGTRL